MHTATLDAFSAPACPPALRAADDRELARRIREGDQAAFRELVERCQAKIVQTACGILGNRHDAEEIAQEVFAKAFFAIRTFDSRGSLFAWLYRIAVNQCYSWLRKNRVQLVFEGAAWAEGTHLHAATDERPAADRAFAGRQLARRLLAQLPEDDRALLLLKEVEGYSVLELSALTGMKESTVKTRLYRARRKLMQCFSREGLRR